MTQIKALAPEANNDEIKSQDDGLSEEAVMVAIPREKEGGRDYCNSQPKRQGERETGDEGAG